MLVEIDFGAIVILQTFRGRRVQILTSRFVRCFITRFVFREKMIESHIPGRCWVRLHVVLHFHQSLLVALLVVVVFAVILEQFVFSQAWNFSVGLIMKWCH